MPTPILVCGESGTGKEVAARHLHAASERASHPFVAVNCAAIPADMLEIELFGHTRNAFAGAEGHREGLLVSAQGGSVFLDEIGELSAAAQLALTRVLEDRTVRPVGGEQEVPLDLRFVCATSKDLAQEVAAGRFREDLYFRVNVIEIKMPPLRRRGADTLALAELFMSEIARQLGLARLEIDATTRAAILRHRWPGNIRELLNFIERSLIFGRFPLETLAPPPETEIETLEVVERRQILDAWRRRMATGPRRPGGWASRARRWTASAPPGASDMKRGLPSWARSVRVRLLVIALLPMLVLLPLLLGMTVWRWSGKVDDLLTVKVNGDLTIAHQYMARLRENSGDRIEALGASVAFAEGMARPDTGTASDFLERRRRALGFDFLYVVTRSGRIIPSDTPVGADVSARDWPVVRAALDGATRSAVDVFDHEQLAALSPALAERARVPLVPTRAAKPTSRDVVEDGMVLHAAAPVRLPGGQRAAWSEGGCSIAISISSIRSMAWSIAIVACPRAARARRPCSSTTSASRPMCDCSKANARSVPESRRRSGRRCWSGARSGSIVLRGQRLVHLRLRTHRR